MPVEAPTKREVALKIVVIRPITYAAVLVAVFFAAYVYKLRTEGIFACQADAYSASIYLGYCNSIAYGDYDHGAFWFELEPDAFHAAANADVLFLGSSRMQFGFSADPTREWFSGRSLDYYLLGFSHTENIVFATPLLEKLRPRARVYVINVDGFFEDRESAPVVGIFHAGGVESEYRRKRIWQYPHRAVCRAVPFVCGEEIAFFRSRERGDWRLSASDALVGSGVGDASAAADADLAQATARATHFVLGLPVDRSCVLLTIVPSAETPRAQARSIAEALGTTLVEPQMADLRTFDGSHLDVSSADRWSRAFFDQAGPHISRCLDVTSP